MIREKKSVIIWVSFQKLCSKRSPFSFCKSQAESQRKHRNLTANFMCISRRVNISPCICMVAGHGNALRRQTGLHLCVYKPMMRDLSFTPCWLFTGLTWTHLNSDDPPRPHTVLSLPSSGSLMMVPDTHTHTAACRRPNKFHRRSLAKMLLELKWQDPQRRSNKCLLIPLPLSFQFISSSSQLASLPAAMQLWK